MGDVLSSNLQLRSLGTADAGLVLSSEAFDNPPTQAWTEAFFAESNHLIFGAIDGAQLVGFASGTILLHPDKPPSLFINEVAVNPAFRRRGIATRLCEKLISAGRERGCEGAWLATETDNAAACALYRALDGRETPGIVVYDWDDAMRPSVEG